MGSGITRSRTPEILDYGRSFLSGRWPGNAVRFWVESRTYIEDERTGESEAYLQCAACKSEDTFAEKDLFYADNYDFTPIFGPRFGLIFRRWAHLNPAYREVKATEAMWGGPIHRLRHPARVRELEGNAVIRAATHDGLPLVAQTELANPELGLRAIIEYPVKTMNIHDERDLYQVDTGPIALPDLSRRPERFADAFSLAYIAFNVPHFADVVIEDETPITHDGRVVTRVHHYSRRLSLCARNRLFAVEE